MPENLFSQQTVDQSKKQNSTFKTPPRNLPPILGHTQIMVLGIEFGNSKKMKFLVSDSTHNRSKTFKFCIERLC